MALVVLTLGSNINKEQNLPAAVRLLTTSEKVIAVSPVYETTPTGLEEQPHFFNAAVLLETHRSPAAIKDLVITEIERALNRVRQADKNAPRTIDLDIALYDDWSVDYIPADGRPRHIPDPDLQRFPHIARPVADLLPDMAHPETGERLHDIADRLLQESIDNGIPPLVLRADIDLASYLVSLPSGRSST